MEFRPTDKQLSDAVRQYIQKQLGFKLSEEFQLNDITCMRRDGFLDGTFALKPARDSERVSSASSRSLLGASDIDREMQGRAQSLIQSGLEPHKAAILKAVAAQPTLLFHGGPIDLGQDACSWYSSSTCSDCHGEGSHTCSECAGSSRVTCNSCGGQGDVRCSRCNSSGNVVEVYSENGQLKERLVPCCQCHGRRYATCDACNGSGSVHCYACDHGTVTCDTCEGKGVTFWRRFLVLRAEAAGFVRFGSRAPAQAFDPAFFGEFAVPQWQSLPDGVGVSMACSHFETKATLSLGGRSYPCVFAGKSPVLVSAPGLVGAYFAKLVEAMDDPGSIKAIAAVNATPIAEELVREAGRGVPMKNLSAVQREALTVDQADRYLARYVAVRDHHSERAGKFSLGAVGLAMRDVMWRLAGVVGIARVVKHFIYSPPALTQLLIFNPHAVIAWTFYLGAGAAAGYLFLPMISTRLTRAASAHWLYKLVAAVLFTFVVRFFAELPLWFGLLVAALITPFIALPRVKKLGLKRASSTLKKMGYAGLVVD